MWHSSIVESMAAATGWTLSGRIHDCVPGTDYTRTEFWNTADATVRVDYRHTTERYGDYVARITHSTIHSDSFYRDTTAGEGEAERLLGTLAMWFFTPSPRERGKTTVRVHVAATVDNETWLLNYGGVTPGNVSEDIAGQLALITTDALNTYLEQTGNEGTVTPAVHTR